MPKPLQYQDPAKHQPAIQGRRRIAMANLGGRTAMPCTSKSAFRRQATSILSSSVANPMRKPTNLLDMPKYCALRLSATYKRPIVARAAELRWLAATRQYLK